MQEADNRPRTCDLPDPTDPRLRSYSLGVRLLGFLRTFLEVRVGVVIDLASEAVEGCWKRLVGFHCIIHSQVWVMHG